MDESGTMARRGQLVVERVLEPTKKLQSLTESALCSKGCPPNLRKGALVADPSEVCLNLIAA